MTWEMVKVIYRLYIGYTAATNWSVAASLLPNGHRPADEIIVAFPSLATSCTPFPVEQTVQPPSPYTSCICSVTLETFQEELRSLSQHARPPFRTQSLCQARPAAGQGRWLGDDPVTKNRGILYGTERARGRRRCITTAGAFRHLHC